MPLPPGTLGQALDQLPQLLLNLGRLQQERREEQLRREIQQASQVFEAKMLERRIEAEDIQRRALEQIRTGMGAYEPPEYGVLRDDISRALRTLNDPDVALTLGDDDIIKRWKRLTNMEADYFGKTGRHISISMPVPVGEALSRVEAAKPPPAGAPPAKVAKPKHRIAREIRPRWTPPEAPPEPLSAEEIAARRAGIPALQPPPPIDIPEGSRSVLTKEGGWIYTLDEKTWISAETGEPITGQ